jgi:hypothetical protein
MPFKASFPPTGHLHSNKTTFVSFGQVPSKAQLAQTLQGQVIFDEFTSFKIFKPIEQANKMSELNYMF